MGPHSEHFLGIRKNRKFSISKLFISIQFSMKIVDLKKFRKKSENIFFEKFSSSKKSKNFIEICMKMKIFEIKNFRFFRTPKFVNAMRTQTDRAPRDFYEIASDQNVVKIMVFYFPKIYGFPMLRSTQSDESLCLLWCDP